MDDEQNLVNEQSDEENLHRILQNSLTSFRDAFQVTCRSTGQPHNQCGQCKACRVDLKIHSAKDWWLQSTDLMRRRFLVALIHRSKPEILDQLGIILRPFVDGKDYTYTRNKFDPNRTAISESMPNANEDNDLIKRHEDLTKFIVWFSQEDKYSQGSFILTILQWCDSELIFTIAFNVFSLQDMESEDEDHRSDLNNLSRLKMCSALSFPSSNYSPLRITEQVLKRPKTTSTNSFHQKSAVSFASTVFEQNDSDNEQRQLVKRTPKYKDFIRQLPIYLAKSILSMLDKKTLNKCKQVSIYWKKMATEVEDEATMTHLLYDDMMLLQGSAALQCNPFFARDTLVPVPDIFRLDRTEKSSPKKKNQEKSTSTWKKMYEANDIPTRLVLMEEKNVYCGPYNVLLLRDDADRRRTVHMSGESIVAISSGDGRVRFIDMQSAQERSTNLIGHAASVRCMLVEEGKNRMFTGSYDLTVRAWNLETGRCTKLYQGHERTVTCLAAFLDLLAAGGNDNLCLVWRCKYTRPWRTFKHKHPVSAVALNENLTLSGDIHGKIKVWHTNNGTLIKAIKHRLMITSVKIDRWHIASSSNDTYASVWTSHGPLNKPLCTFRHPKEVLCLEFLYLRLITGCADGKIRIWSALSGHCLRVMRGNSLSDPVTGLTVTPNRILINTQSNLLLMNFEPIKYDYTLEEDRAPVARTPTPPRTASSSHRRKRSSTAKQRQPTSILKANEQILPNKEKAKEPKILFDNEKVELDLSLEETKELLKRQIRGGVDEKRKLLPEEFRLIQQSPFYRPDQSQDDTVYAEHRCLPMKIGERPPSSPSRFDLKTRINRTQSHNRSLPVSDRIPNKRPTSPSTMFEVVHRPPSQVVRHLTRQPSDPSLHLKPPTDFDDKLSSSQSVLRSRLEKAPATPTIYQVKRGGKIYKVVVGYVSPFTSPMERNELHLKTQTENEQIIKNIQKQQEKQRTNTSQFVSLGPPKFK